MAKVLISFPVEAMDTSPEALAAASVDSHRVIADAKAAGVYVFGGGIDEAVPPVLVDAQGGVCDGTYPGSRLTGGFLVLDVPDRAAAEHWAARIAAACRCTQELRVFGDDPDS